MEDHKIELSTLGHTWILDLDGTLVKHNGYKIDGHDTLLPGVHEFLNNISKDDMVIIVTSRTMDSWQETEHFLKENNIKYDHIIYGAPYGERLLLNDDKESGLCMAYALRTKRNVGMKHKILIRDDI